MSLDLKRFIMRHHRTLSPALDLAAHVRSSLLIPYEAFDRYNLEVREALSAELSEVLSAGNVYDLWSYARRFEHDFAARCGKRHGVGTSSCTAALEMTLAALGVGPGDEVITSAHTFIATALAIRNRGAVPILVDPRHGDLCVTADDMERQVGRRTRAILPVHMHGHVCDMDPILDLGRRRGVPVVEDCAQAFGSSYRGRKVPVGPIGCFSFWANKPLGGAGNGGMLVTDDEDLAHRVDAARDPDGNDPLVLTSGRTPGYLDALEVAVLRARLPRFGAWRERRAAIAKRYMAAFKDLDPVLPGPGVESAWYSFVLRVDRRDDLRGRLLRRQVETKIEYEQPFFASRTFGEMEWNPNAWPEAKAAADRGLSIPVHPLLTDDEVERVIRAASRAA